MTYKILPNQIPENFTLHGIFPDLTRMPADVAASVSEAVSGLSKCPAGGRLRFKTDSAKIIFEADFVEENVNCAADILCDGVFAGQIGPFGYDFAPDHISGEAELPSDGELHNIVIFLPRTIQLKEVRVTLDDGARVLPAEDYKTKLPIVYYGSSITMGAMATSPSRAYTALVSERLGADHINLGFGGSAKGEVEMANYIASLEMSAFVLDYEHNAPTLDHLRQTHKPFFDIIRKAHPELPILMISRPDTDGDFLRVCRGRQIIMDTFHTALDDGDKLVDYVDGFYLWGNDGRENCCREDGCHPNDEGFKRMADVIAPRLEKLMNRVGTVAVTEEDGFSDRFLKRL